MPKHLAFVFLGLLLLPRPAAAGANLLINPNFDLDTANAGTTTLDDWNCIRCGNDPGDEVVNSVYDSSPQSMQLQMPASGTDVGYLQDYVWTGDVCNFTFSIWVLGSSNDPLSGADMSIEARSGAVWPGSSTKLQAFEYSVQSGNGQIISTGGVWTQYSVTIPYSDLPPSTNFIRCYFYVNPWYTPYSTALFNFDNASLTESGCTTPTPTPGPCDPNDEPLPALASGGGSTWTGWSGGAVTNPQFAPGPAMDGDDVRFYSGTQYWWPFQASSGSLTDAADPITSVQVNVVWWGVTSDNDQLNLDYSANGTTTGLLGTSEVVNNSTFTNGSESGEGDSVVTLAPPSGSAWTWEEINQLRVFLNYSSGSDGSVYLNALSVTVNYTPACGTPSDTPTDTSTITLTDTATSTPSVTPTATPSSTRSATPSPTATSTASPSDTPTPTSTATPTFTATATATVTTTLTPSFSPTESFTGTASATATPTDTATNTTTSTFSPTASFTQTATATETPSVTPSYTATQTSTATQSTTDTPTITPTFTATPTGTATESATLTPTQSATFTATPTSTETESATPTPTQSATFTATPTSTETGSATSTPTQSATFTATPTLTATATVTPSSTVTASPTATATRSDTPTVTLTATVTMTYTVTNTPVPVPDRVSINIYNSAGELVRSLFNGPAEYQPGGIGLSSDLVESGGAGGSLSISFPGLLALPNGTYAGSIGWSASNNNGQAVSSGVYTIQVQVTNNYGQVATLDKLVQVIDVASENSLKIYNGAGEVVYNLSLPAVEGGIVSMSLPSTTYAPVYEASTGKASPMYFDVTAGSGPAPAPLEWYGVNDQGEAVAAGVYTAQLVYDAPGGTQTTIERSFTVVATGALGLSGLVAAPNPVLHGTPLEIFYNPVAPGYAVVGELYDLVGQKVAESAAQGAGPLDFQTQGLASGIYLAAVELKADGSSAASQRRILKVAVLR